MRRTIPVTYDVDYWPFVGGLQLMPKIRSRRRFAAVTQLKTRSCSSCAHVATVVHNVYSIVLPAAETAYEPSLLRQCHVVM